MMNKYEKNIYKNLFEYPTKIIAELELKNEQLEKENQQLKKQKDDVVEYIKKDWYSKNTIDINKAVIGDWRIDVLRMLGEKDD